MVNNLISIGLGREDAFAAALLGDTVLMEKAWQETGMFAEAALHAHVYFGSWSTFIEKLSLGMEQDTVKREYTPSTKMDSATAFLASLEKSKLTTCKMLQRSHRLKFYLLPWRALAPSEPDASVPPVSGSSAPARTDVNDETSENQNQTSSSSVSEPDGTEESVPPASKSPRPTTTHDVPKQPENQETNVRPEL
ncbi:unnamed protein product [Fraxinus pennsylvanica]|uniref:Uncharacterized protein n=1 Tax=Fraxinus pennsylvanica TaxID=56036 RepID=A0AAD1ZH26_9LAMI|nr:unnamed protein product [Fraxinus pennsylvanica]